MIEWKRESISRITVHESGLSPYEKTTQVGYIKDSCCYTLIKSNNITNAIRVDYHVGKGGLLANNYKGSLLTEYNRSGDKGKYNEYLAEYERKVMNGEIVGEYDLALKEIFMRCHENKAYYHLCKGTTVMVGVSDIISGKYLTNIESKKFKVILENLENKKSAIHYTTVAEYDDFIKQYDTTKFAIK